MSGSKSDGDGRGSACPVAGKPKNQQEYNVYSQPIDPSNQMPAGTANQLPAPQQSKPLSTDRVVSNIPKVAALTNTLASCRSHWRASLPRSNTF
jgi:hypothetical protein